MSIGLILVIIYLVTAPFAAWHGFKSEKDEELHVKTANAWSSLGTYSIAWVMIILLLDWLKVI